MKLPLQISFRNLSHSEAIEEIIHEKASRLDRFWDRIMACRVVVDVPHRHHQHGNHYQVRIDLTVPGEEIVINRNNAANGIGEALDVAIRDAFEAAARRLEDWVRRHRHQVKTHEPLPEARIHRLFPDEGYGFLLTPDGREVYFHRNSIVTGSFDQLRVGTEVTFVEEAGEKGPQASTVKPRD